MDVNDKKQDKQQKNKMEGSEEKRPVLSGETQQLTEPTFSFSGMSRRQTLILISAGLANFCGYTCFALLAPFFPIEAEKKGASPTVVGFVFGGFQLVIFLSSSFYGNFLTRIGSKFMFVAGVFTGGVCTILFGLLDRCPDGTVYIVMLFVTRAFEGLGTSALVTASFAILSYEFPNGVARVIGTLEIFTGFGLMVGPPIGGALYQVGGYELPFFVMGSLLVCCSLMGYVLMPEQPASSAPFERSVFTLFRSPLALIVGLCAICFFFTLGFIDPTLARHLDKFKLKTVYIGLVFLLAPMVYALTAPLWGWIGDVKGYDKSIIATSCIFAGLAFLVLGPVPFLSFIPFKLYIVIITLLVFGFFVAGGIVLPYSVLNSAARQLDLPDSMDTYGITSGFINACYSLGAFLGPTFAGILTERVGFPWAASVCSALLFISGLAMWIYIIWEQCSKQKQGYKKVKGSDFVLH